MSNPTIFSISNYISNISNNIVYAEKLFYKSGINLREVKYLGAYQI